MNSNKQRFVAQRHSLSQIIMTVAALPFMLLTLLLLIPFAPRQPDSGLDNSWAYAANEAVAMHLVFGRDFILTFGPFASVYTRLYHPATDVIMLVGGTLIAAAVCSGFVLLASNRRFWVVALAPLVVVVANMPDAIFMAVPLQLLVAAVAVPNRSKCEMSAPTILFFSILISGIAILPLVKESFVAGSAFLGAISLLLLIKKGHLRLATALTILGVLVMCLGWVWTGQPIDALPVFFASQTPIIHGYTEAMSSNGPCIWLVYWILAALTCFVSLLRFGLFEQKIDRILACTGLAAYFFISFKAGFVRQDGHVKISIDALFYAALILSAVIRPKAALLMSCIVLFLSVKAEHAVARSFAGAHFGDFHGVIHRAMSDISVRNGGNILQSNFEKSNAEIRDRYPFQKLSGSVDIYPTELSLIFANKMEWSGRPVPQSYLAYTPSLDRRNADHLLGPYAPQNILFKIEPIDTHYSSLEDSGTWPILLSNYRVIGETNNYIQMEKKSSAPLKFHQVTDAEARFNELINVPLSEKPLIVSIDMKKTFFGEVALTLFRLPYVYIEVTLEGGEVLRERYIPEMGESGFILSPYVGSTRDFLLMAAGATHVKRVKKMRFSTTGMGLWRHTFHISYSTFDSPAQVVAQSLNSIRASAAPTNITQAEGPPTAECSFDQIDGIGAAGRDIEFKVTRFGIELAGWGAPSASNGVGPEEIWIEIANLDGSRKFYKVPIVARPDVSEAFKHPSMKNSGFNFVLDSHDLAGPYTMSLLTTTKSAVQLCPIRKRIVAT